MLPAIRALAPTLPVPISIDTYKASTAEVALTAGPASSTMSGACNAIPRSPGSRPITAPRWW